MISAGSAVAESRPQPSPDCSASRFCGGAIGPPLKPVPWPLARLGALMGRSILGRPSEDNIFSLLLSACSRRSPGGAGASRDLREAGEPYSCATTIVLTVAI